MSRIHKRRRNQLSAAIDQRSLYKDESRLRKIKTLREIGIVVSPKTGTDRVNSKYDAAYIELRLARHNEEARQVEQNKRRNKRARRR